MLKFISYNILFGKKLESIIKWLNKTEKNRGAFDIVCLQEFPQDKINDFLKRREKNTTDFRYAPCFSKDKRNFGQLTIFNKNKLKLTKSAVLPLNLSRVENKVIKFFRTRAERKSLLTCFTDLDQKHFLVANTHLTCISSNGHRLSQLRNILKEIASSPKALIAGDLNYSSLLPRSKLRQMMKKYCFKDATAKLKTHRLFFIKHQLDYIFVKGLLAQTKAATDIRFSDHYPLIAEIEL